MNTPPTPSLGSKPLATVNEVAAFLKVSRSWVYQHAEAGDLPCMRLFGVLRFNLREIARWAAAQGAPSNIVGSR